MTQTNYSATYTPNGNCLVSYENALTADKTRIHIQAYLNRVDNLFKKNMYGEYVFSFTPYTMDDNQRLYEHIEKWSYELEYNLLFNPHEDVVVKPKYHDNMKCLVCSQFDLSKVQL